MEELPKAGLYTVEISIHDSDSKNETYNEVVGFCDFVKETWLQNGVVHRNGGPAIIRRDINSGNILSREWFDNGLRHRVEAPAFLYEHDDITVHAWYEMGKRHRIGGPSFTEVWQDTGLVFREEWQQSGDYHRPNGPARIARDGESGIITYEWWYRDGKLHRKDDKPAIICRSNEDGLTYSQEWYQDGKLHRANGPAKVDRNGPYGEKIKFEYYEHGNKIAFQEPKTLDLSF